MSKFDKFKTEKGVYVGESGRSIYERAGEHRQDAGKIVFLFYYFVFLNNCLAKIG